MSEYSRRVSLSVSIDGYDVAGAFAPYLLDFSYKDEAGGKSDDIQITLQNRDGRFSGPWRPKKGMEVIASIICTDWEGEGDYQELPCGSFKIDEVELSGPPDKIKIKAVSASLSGGLRDTQKTRAWENTSLQTVTDQIAKENNLEPMYIGEDVQFERQDQRNESDISFLNRLAGDFGMNCKAHNGKLIMFDSEEAEKADVVMELAKTGSMYSPKSYSFKMSSSSTDYDKAEVAYTDPKTGKTQKASTKSESKDTKKGGSEKSLTLNQRVENAAQAMKLSRSKLHKANQKEQTASLECMGCPKLVAGVNVNLTGFEEFSGKWCIKSATHKLSGNGGYSVSLELTAPALTEEAGAEELECEAAVEAREKADFQSYAEENARIDALAKIGFQEFHESLPDYIGPLGELIICLPDILEAEAKRSEEKNDVEKAKGYKLLRQVFIRWLAFKAQIGSENNPDTLWVDWNWLLSEEKAKEAFEDLKANLMNEAAQKALEEKLKKAGCFTNKMEYFTFISEIPKNWKADHHQHRTVESNILERILMWNGHVAALGNYTFYGLVNGYVKHLNKKTYRIYITKAAIAMLDSFDFEGSQHLGFWDCPDKKYLGIDLFSPIGMKLSNEGFNIFRNTYNKGADFYLATYPKEVENLRDFHYDVTL